MSQLPDETMKSVAEATTSVSNAACKGMELTERAASFLAKLLGEDAAGIIRDRIFYYRVLCAVSLQDRLDQKLEQRQIENPRAIPLRFAIPFLEAATLEDTPELQEMWARLLATAMDPASTVEMHRYFGTILQSISPVDCHVMDAIVVLTCKSGRNEVKAGDVAEHLAQQEKDVRASFQRLKGLGLLEDGTEPKIGSTRGEQPFYQDRTLHYVTELGFLFLNACSKRPLGQNGMSTNV